MDTSLSREIEDLDGNLENPKRRALLKQFFDAHKAYIKDMIEINNLILKRNDIINNTLDVIGPEVAKHVEDVNASVMKDQEILGLKLNNNTDASIKLSLTLSALAIAVGLLFGVSINNCYH